MLHAYGRFVHRHRWAILLLSAVLLAASVAVVLRGGELTTYQAPANTESGEASLLVESQVPGAADATFLLVLSHPTQRWDQPAFKDEAQRSLAALKADPRVASVVTPYDVPVQQAATMVSRDAHRILAVVTLKEDFAGARDDFPELRAKVASPTLDVKATDRIAVFSDIEQTLAKDLVKAEIVSLPLSLVLLLVVFGTVAAALLPLGVGLLAVVGGMALVFTLSHFTDVAVYATNIVSLIGLGVAIDYSLFMVSRFREELAHGDGVEEALARTLATAGRATAFSGLTVAIGLLGLTFYQGLFFASMGVAGALVVGLAVLYALTFLPALFSVMGHRINKWPVPMPRRKTEGQFWARLARGVMARPLTVLLPVLAVLLLAGLPFLQMEMGSAGVTQLPEDAESRVGYELLQREFPGQGLTAVTVVVSYPAGGDPLSRERVAHLYDLSRSLATIPGVENVQGVVDLDPRLGKADYQRMYAGPRAQLPEGAQQVVERTVGASIVVLRVMVDGDEASQAAKDVVGAIRAHPEPGDARILVTGPTAIDVDTIALVKKHTPAAILFIVGTTYVLLLLQTGSVILPLKALAMNVLSIAASFGALVWIFQQGNLSALLDFTPAPIDPSTPVLLFCIVFGLSMDYEVLLLSRMHEEYEKTGDNALAVENGLAKSGRLITSAAAIMVLVFGAFTLASVTIIKAIGFGLALAVALDATLVRALVVPASMRLMGRWNWWAPKWVTKLWKTLG